MKGGCERRSKVNSKKKFLGGGGGVRGPIRGGGVGEVW